MSKILGPDYVYRGVQGVGDSDLELWKRRGGDGTPRGSFYTSHRLGTKTRQGWYEEPNLF